MENTKKCCRCKQYLSLEAFVKDASRKDGKFPYCRECDSTRNGRKCRSTVAAVELTVTQAAYIAGLIDGEGCICVYRTKNAAKKVQYNLSVTIKMGGDFLRELYHEVGLGHFQQVRRPKHQSCWKDLNQWRWAQAVSRCLLPQVRPYLRHKAKQADIALQFLALPWKGTTEQKAELYKRCRKLNRRGNDGEDNS